MNSKSSAWSWSQLWTRLSLADRNDFAREYLLRAEENPSGEAIVRYLASRTRTGLQAVRGWPIAERAAQLAGIDPLRPAYARECLTLLHRSRRAPMVARFAAVAGISNTEGVATDGEPVPVDRLLAAVEAVEGEFPSAESALYFDALELQRTRSLAYLTEARMRAATRRKSIEQERASLSPSSPTTPAGPEDRKARLTPLEFRDEGVVAGELVSREFELDATRDVFLSLASEAQCRDGGIALDLERRIDETTWANVRSFEARDPQTVMGSMPRGTLGDGRSTWRARVRTLAADGSAVRCSVRLWN